MGDLIDIATNQTDVFEFTVGQGRQSVAGNAGVVPVDDGRVDVRQNGADTASKSLKAIVRAGDVICSHILVLFSGVAVCLVVPGN